MSAEFERLIVEPLLIHDGENGFVVRAKIKRKMDCLIRNHNDLVRIIHRSLSKGGPPHELENHWELSEHHPEWDKGQWIPFKPTNKPGDVIDLLIQMRYICQCVAATIVKLPVSTRPWCKDCNRPNLDHEKEETNAY